MKMWTNEQLLALEVHPKNAIISAGAGSGKTAVLTTRVYEIIKNKLANIDELLVLTFTNAAAQEMRERIKDNLREDQLYEDAEQVDAASITTFDAYALSLVKKYHYYLDLPQSISIIDDTIIEVEKQKIIDDVFYDFYHKHDADFILMINTYCAKRDTVLRNFVKDILRYGDLQVDKKKVFKNYLATHFTSSLLDQYLAQTIDIIKRKYGEAIEQLTYLSDLKLIEGMQTSLESVLDKQDYDDIYLAIVNFKFPIVRHLEEDDKKVRENIKKSVDALNKKIKLLGNTREVTARFFNTTSQHALGILLNITTMVDERLDHFKKEKSSFTFSDIAKMALEIVQIPEVNVEIKKGIKFVMIDECQDTSDIQDTFIQFISSNNVYMVGDTKQSIYRFRNANCELFQNRYENYKDNNEGYKIDLTKNFRSRHEVIDDINGLFKELMTPFLGGVDYKRDHIIQFGNVSYDEYGMTKQNQNLEIFTYQPDKNNIEQEASIIAADIIDKINSGYQVYDKKKQANRPCTFQDFAILDASKSSFDTFLTVFDAYKISIKVYKEELVASSQIGNLFSSLVHLLVDINHQRFDAEFKHAFVAIVRSFVVRYDDEKIYRIVKENKIFQDEYFLLIKRIYLENNDKPLNCLLSPIIEGLHIYEHIPAIGNVEANLANINNLLKRTEDMANLGYNLDDYFDYLQLLKQMKMDIKNENAEEAGNVVRMMTIHKSKGLEFPIVYCPNLYKHFNLADARTAFLTSNKYGIILPVIDGDSEENGNITRFLAREEEIKETISEKIRLFYVALTRAKEKIILLENGEKNKPVLSLQKANSFQDFINYVEQKKLSFKRSEKRGESVLLNNQETIKTETTALTIEPRPAFTEKNIVIPERASKTVDDHVDEELLRFGNELHQMMEIVNLVKKDTTFISESKVREIIDKVLALEIFTNLADAQVLKEYAYIDNDKKYVIDLLIIKNHKAIIVDYKSSAIDDPAYDRQLKIYEKYISSTFHLTCDLYLISLIKGTYRLIKKSE